MTYEPNNWRKNTQITTANNKDAPSVTLFESFVLKTTFQFAQKKLSPNNMVDYTRNKMWANDTLYTRFNSYFTPQHTNQY